MNKKVCYTIGHSNHTFEKFLDLLKRNDIDCIVDVRSSPYSKYASQFNKESLEHNLKENKIQYIFMGNLLGAKIKDSEFYNKNKLDGKKLINSSFFKDGIDRIIKGINKGYKISIMCSEKDPKECHRFCLISKVLSDKNIEVRHIFEDGNYIEHRRIEDQLLKNYYHEISFDDIDDIPKNKSEDLYREIFDRIAIKMDGEVAEK